MKAAFAIVLAGVGLVATLAATHQRSRALPFYVDATLTPRWPVDGASDDMHVVGDFRMVDQRGDTVTRRTVTGHIYVASFFYSTCRTLCPEIRDELVRVRNAYEGDGDVLILSHSVTPETDDVGRLAHYAHVNGIDHRQWRLLTGSRSELERLARERYFVELADTTGNTRGTLRHTETLVLVDRTGHIRGVYDGSMPFEVTQLIKDIGTLKREADVSP